MAEIFVARPEDPDATDAGAEVVVKRILPAFRSKTDFSSMFRDEAKLASLLDHPNIVRIVEVGLDASGPDGQQVPFIAMEHLRGVNLRELLVQLKQQGRTLPVLAGASILAGALRGLSHAHEFKNERGEPLRIVHRDVSPQNIIVTFDGAVKLLDFGVAKAEGRLHQTQAGMIKGKFAYMAPEQVQGRELDARSDLFSLAETIYELMLARHPFFADNEMDILRKVLDEEPHHPTSIDPDFPKPLATILMKGLRKQPSERFDSARAMLRALSDWVSSLETRVRSTDLAQLVRSSFSERLEAEERARRAGDETQLIEVLRAGRTIDDDLSELYEDEPPEQEDTDQNLVGAESRPFRRREDSVQVIPVRPSQVQPAVLIRRSPGSNPQCEPTNPRVDAANASQPRVAGQNPNPPAAPERPVPGPVREDTPTHRTPPVAELAAPGTEHRDRLDMIVFAAGALALGIAVFMVFRGAEPGPTATVEVVSSPPGAQVFLDGRLQRRSTPVEIHPEPGQTVRIEVVGQSGRCTHEVEVPEGKTRVGCQLDATSGSSG